MALKEEEGIPESPPPWGHWAHLWVQRSLNHTVGFWVLSVEEAQKHTKCPEMTSEKYRR